MKWRISVTSKQGGRRTKDSPISDAFNTLKVGATITKKDISTAKRMAKLEKLRQDEEKRKQRVELDKLRAKVDKVVGEIGNVPDAPLEVEDAEDAISDTSDSSHDEDEKSAYQMLQHLRYAYKNSKNSEGKKGRSRLMSLMEADAEFKFFVKELMKIEAALLAAKLRKGEDEGGNKIGQQNFFVVLKGLEDEKKFLGVDDKTVDMKQIQRAMNPTADQSYEQEEEVSKRDAPEQLQKTNSVEEW
jgi:hypothetical protein